MLVLHTSHTPKPSQAFPNQGCHGCHFLLCFYWTGSFVFVVLAILLFLELLYIWRYQVRVAVGEQDNSNRFDLKIETHEVFKNLAKSRIIEEKKWLVLFQDQSVEMGADPQTVLANLQPRLCRIT